MKLDKSGLVIEVTRDADPAVAAKVTQFLANSINGPVVAKCTFGDVTVTPGTTVTPDVFTNARAWPDERDDEPAAIEVAAPAHDDPVNVPEKLKPKPGAKK